MEFIYISRRQLRIGIVACLLFVIGIVGYGLVNIFYEETLSRVGELVILLDPGHGGVDGGTRDQWGNLEKDINLAVGKLVDHQLQSCGMQVLMSRKGDIALAPFTGQPGRHRRDLLERIRRAREENCLFLVSIHCDWSRDVREMGAKVFYNALQPESKNLASLIQQELNRVQIRQRKEAPGKYLMIRQEGITGVIVEVGFLSNSQEALLLQNELHRSRLAFAISRGILKYSQSFLDGT
ncbi:N-acetylmuramoyl-L-alanine amidase [Hydrogenispora ethanolica]|uniref:N-acetylmuramoyl-L-alanine amidase n=1 Tax=Hydrogenispora ethanolica TaxID=1082276 RepID=A0A4R1RTW5_HYDET|nr:N-acetylmuramoyl-L-alanine amidase [Hydrogenispora ethanolica]TCL69993.1 N-acetylmuramoyl-L-alanine amidase [Hydrogenispora ethanolica]